MGERADVAALAHVLPGVVVGDGAVGVQFEGHLGVVEHADGDDESAHAHAHAHVPALGLGRLGLGLVLVVDRLGLLEQSRIDVVVIRTAVDGEVTGPGGVLVAELPGIDACLLGRHVDERLGGGVDLGRAEAAVGGVEGVVGRAAAGQGLEVGDVVAVEADGDKVAEDRDDRVGAMVESDVVLGGDDLALLVAGDPAVGEGGRSLAGGVVELVVAQAQAAGHVQVLDGRDDQRVDVRGDGVAERTADAVQDHADVVLGNAAWPWRRASVFSERFWHLHWMVIMPSMPQ